jgi:L-histidine N-alpha-methyltransferase
VDQSAHVTIHSSQFPQKITRDLLDSLRARDLKQKFHYETVKQAQQWLALHEAYSPARRDPGCLQIYADAAAFLATQVRENLIHVAGLGCGGGQKDTAILSELRRAGRTAIYTPCDSSVQMVLTAQTHASEVLKGLQCHPLVCDLPDCTTLPALLKEHEPIGSERVITLFGVLHNFVPNAILPRILNAVRSQDSLLLSANLSPGPDYHAGVRQILPQYDNDLTKQWLLTALLDFGVERDDGELHIQIAQSPAGLDQIEGRFYFARARTLRLYAEEFTFAPSDTIRLFTSDRYTSEKVAETLRPFHLQITQQWLAPSGEEGVFLCKRR